MDKLLLKNVIAHLPNETIKDASILIEAGKIVNLRSQNTNSNTFGVFDLSNHILYAGFIDIHNHGAVGVDINTASVEDLRKVSKFLASQGVTGWLPTFVPDTDENYRKVIAAMDEVMDTQAAEPNAQILGVHYEGVFANEKMCGALRPQFFKTFRNADESKVCRV
jgi:N-acetylglucosamine-6-phosphate deacetylase